MRENTNKSRTWLTWSRSIALLSLLVMVPLAGCGDASKTDSDTDQKDQAKSEKKVEEKDVSKEDLEAEMGPIDTAESELVDITEKVIVKEVVDGDTVVVEGENGEETVALAMVNAPKSTLPDGSNDNQFGMKSKQYTASLLEGREVRWEQSGSTNGDGNATGYIWVKQGSDNENFNEILLVRGLARLSEPTDDRYIDRFREAESEAKEKKENIWSVEGYVTADGYNASLVQ